MKLRSITLASIAFLSLAVAGVVWAQGEKPGQHQLHALGGPFIVYRANIQEELKLSDEQKQKLREKLPGYLQETAKVLEKGLAAGEMRSIRQKAYDEIWPFLKETLKADQLKRFQQLELQHEGPTALLGRPEIGQELKITDEQRNQLMGVVQDMKKRMEVMMKEAHSGGNQQEIWVKAKKIYADEEVKIEAILSDAQKKQWLEMYGRPFDVFNDKI
jgi:hypothetical protein